MKNILVTGGAGFIGFNLCKRLLDEGNQVTCLDNFYSSNPNNVRDLMEISGFTFIKHNVVDPLTIENNFDEIYHLACPASPKQYQRNPIFTLDTNYLGSKNILEFAMIRNSKVLLTSTSEVYGDPLVHPQPETYWGNVNPVGVRSCYDEGKRVAETLFMDYNKFHNIPIKIARIFNTFGPRMNKYDGRVVSSFINQALLSQPLTIYGDGSQTRTLCYIDDMIDGLIALMLSGDDNIGPINIGGEEEMTINEIADLIIELTSSESKKIYDNLPKDDPRIRKPELMLAHSKLNWRQRVDIRKALSLTIDYYRNNLY
jgi:UDP-glucuronate decarboxylase